MLADDAVTSAKIASGTIATADLADSAVTSAKIADGTVAVADLATGVKSGLMTNCQSTTLTTVTSTTVTTAGTYYDVSGLSVSITPTASTSKVLISGQIQVANGTTNTTMNARIMRDTTAVGVGSSPGSRVNSTVGAYLGLTSQNVQYPLPFQYLDSPATTSATTYKIQVSANTSGAVIHTNRSGSDADDSGQFRTISTITAIEVL